MTIPKKRQLVVHANPYLTLDRHGRPANAVRLDPSVSNGQRRYIGAKASSTVIELYEKGDKRGPGLGDHTYIFDLAPKSIDDTPYHRDRLRDGELIPGDEYTARAGSSGGITLKFLPVDQVIAESRVKAFTAWVAQHDEPPQFTKNQDAESVGTKAAKPIKPAAKPKADQPAKAPKEI